MDYPKLPVTISYIKPFVNGQTLVNVTGVTTSIPTYAGGFYVAKLAFTEVVATGSTYESSLSNLLIAATSSAVPNPGFQY